jgi:hypothetical protein
MIFWMLKNSRIAPTCQQQNEKSMFSGLESKTFVLNSSNRNMYCLLFA